MTGSPQLIGSALLIIAIAALLLAMRAKLSKHSRMVRELQSRIKGYEAGHPDIEHKMVKEAELSAGTIRRKIIAQAELDAQTITDKANQYCIETRREIEDSRKELKQAEKDVLLWTQYAETHRAKILDTALTEAEQIFNEGVGRIKEVEVAARLAVEKSVNEGIRSITDMQDQARDLERIQTQYVDFEQNWVKEAESAARIVRLKITALAELDAQKITDRADRYCIEARREIEDSRKELRRAEEDAFLWTQFAKKHRAQIVDNAVVEAENILNENIRKIEEKKVAAQMAVEEARELEQGLQAEYIEVNNLYNQLVDDLAKVETQADLFHSGVYEPLYAFGDSESFKVEIKKLRDQQKLMITDKEAVRCSSNWRINDSQVQGRVWANRGVRLTLRAFNGACDAAIRRVRWNNIHTMIAHIKKERAQIDKLNASNNIVISDGYCDLKLQELRLTHELREKIKEEREERAAKARAAREEEKLNRDMELAEQEEQKYKALLDEAHKLAASAHGAELAAYEIRIVALQAALDEAHSRFVRAQAMAEMTRSGWVYIISNVGSFGPDIVKIGLTRRLDPMDRVRELGAASVPFLFDTHAMIYSEDAPGLERRLHAEFAAERVNASNFRKEFFRVSLEQVEQAVRKLSPDAPFIRDIGAQEYQETLALRNTRLEQAEDLRRHFSDGAL